LNFLKKLNLKNFNHLDYFFFKFINFKSFSVKVIVSKKEKQIEKYFSQKAIKIHLELESLIEIYLYFFNYNVNNFFKIF